MLIDLTDIIKNSKDKLLISESFEMPKITFMGEDFVFSSPLRVEGSILNNSKTLELHLEVSGKAEVHCARCGKPLSVDVNFPVTETLVRENSESSGDEEAVIYSGNEIELDDIITTNFLMTVPVKYLCREDCKGLCPSCGADLNETTCDCDKETMDPRWEKLAEIMKNMTDTE